MRTLVDTCGGRACSRSAGVAMRIMIYGSCISRDTLELSTHADLELAGYYARSSMISAFGGTRTNLGSSVNSVSSSFQRRMLEADAGKSLGNVLRSQEFDVLLVDLVDERFHVMAHEDERITDSPAFRETRYLNGKARAWRRIVSGSDEHFAEWTQAADRFLHLVVTKPSKVRLVFLDADWATKISGAIQHDALRHAGQTPAQANLLYARYRDYLRERLPAENVIRPPAEVTVSDPDQKWGLAPFHYVPEFYDYVSRCLVAMPPD